MWSLPPIRTSLDQPRRFTNMGRIHIRTPRRIIFLLKRTLTPPPEQRTSQHRRERLPNPAGGSLHPWATTETPVSGWPSLHENVY